MTDEKEQKYQDPNLAINRVYTKKGDAGETKLVGGQKVSKSAARIEAYGTVDELNSVIGAARQTIVDDYPNDDRFQELSETLLRVQHELFNLGSVLATLPEDVGEQMPRIEQEDIDALERSIDELTAELPELRSFVLPGGSRLNVELHRARTVCRRAERRAVELDRHERVSELALAYLNRLSDAFFVWSRWATVQADVEEVLWQPNMSASAKKRDE
ncbi:MAG: cob(I)yrinic acid a,c-diamide adenosyltransferase [Myxococcota bacterium]